MLEQKQAPRPQEASFWLDAASPLAESLAGFRPRAGQKEMAVAVERTLRQQVPLLAEAATGTGKTLAYLIPVVLSELKTVVSTGTRTLQDQISQKELPLLKEAMAPSLSWAVLKGRANYLCLRRFADFSGQPDLALEGAAGGLAVLTSWAEDTADGDLDQIRGQGLNGSLIAEVTANSEQCLGSRCPKRDKCFLMEARRRAAEADVVVVNHHLFLADLQLRAQGHGEALPRYQAVIFDEAHLMAEVATQVFGVSVSQRRLAVLLRDLAREVKPKPEARAAAARCEAAGARLFKSVRDLAGEPGSLGLTPTHFKRLAPAGRELAQALEELAAALGLGEEEEVLAGRAQTLAYDLEAVARPEPGQNVAWAQASKTGAALNLSPVEVGPHLDAALYQDMGRLVFTSATLAVGGELDLARERLGLPYESGKLVVPTPFDPACQALLYVPAKMPLPTANGFAQAVAEEVEKLLGLTGGRAFVLFTTHRNLEAVSGILNGRLPFPCLVQGQAPRMKLLEQFVEQSPSVLFATASFWQGVDVPGPALSAVIVDKLPFAPPDDPLVAARMEHMEKDGKSGFAHLMVPEAILTLKQGLGRLLRTPEDRGLLAVLDVRLNTKSYGKRFLKALEPVPLTRDVGEVARFFAE